MNEQAPPEAVDVVVAGSGGAGLTAAIRAARAGLSVLVAEKTPYFGGATALSGGGMWIPGNRLALEAGFDDSPQRAAAYISALVGDIVHTGVLGAFVENGPRMVDFLLAQTELRLALHPGEPDYFQELEGAAMDGRLLSPIEYDGRLIAHLLPKIRPPLQEFNAPAGFMINFEDIPHLTRVGKSLGSTGHVLKLVVRYAMDRLRYPRGTRLTMGNALVGRLLKTAVDEGVVLLNHAAVTRLLTDRGAVTGAEIQRPDATYRVTAERAVVLASGGFAASAEMRRKFLPYADQHVSLMPEGNTGDGINAALQLGARLETGNHADAAYTVISVVRKPDGSLGKYPHVFFDRPKPGCIAVNAAGRRFGNEAAADFVKAMHASGSVPAHLVCDHAFIRRYGLGLVFPGGIGLKKMLRLGYLQRAPDLPTLAGLIGVDAAALAETVAAMNDYAESGVDAEFHKGESAVDLALGDPEHRPNPCLGKIAAAPYYAVKIFPGDGSSMLGLRVNANAQVVAGDTDEPVPGLYACGLDMNALWRGREPSHGSYNALAMTFGFVAASHLSGSD